MTWPVIILWILIIGVMPVRGPGLLYLFSGTAIFGSMTMLPQGAGTNVPPQALCAAVLIARTLLRRADLAKATCLALDQKRLGFLFLFMIYSVVSAYFLPRLFAGQVMVITLNNALRGAVPVGPSFANVSQAVYLSLSVSMAFVFAVKARDAMFLQQYLDSVLLAAVLLLGSGVADMVTAACGRTELLTPFHNASYALLTNADLAGQKRIVGFMPEASTFGFTCVTFLSFLIFCYHDFPRARRRFILPGTVGALALMAFLSTSSTAIIGLAVLALLLIARFARHIFAAGRRDGRRVFILISAVWGASLACALVMACVPGFTSWLSHFMDAILFDKTNSSSYGIRSLLTQSAIGNFWQTNSLGVGLGSVRTSNWFVSILASTGVPGTVLLVLAFIAALLGLRTQRERALRDRGRRIAWSLVPIGAMMFVAGSTSDPGAFNMAALGIVVALTKHKSAIPQQPELPIGVDLAAR